MTVSSGVTFPVVVVAAATMMSSLSACALPLSDDGSATHYVILGFGIVSVQMPEHDNATAAISHQALGLMAASWPTSHIAFGYSAGTTIAIPGDADVLVSVDETPDGALTISQVSFGSDCYGEIDCND